MSSFTSHVLCARALASIRSRSRDGRNGFLASRVRSCASPLKSKQPWLEHQRGSIFFTRKNNHTREKQMHSKLQEETQHTFHTEKPTRDFNADVFFPSSDPGLCSLAFPLSVRRPMRCFSMLTESMLSPIDSWLDRMLRGSHAVRAAVSSTSGTVMTKSLLLFFPTDSWLERKLRGRHIGFPVASLTSRDVTESSLQLWATLCIPGTSSSICGKDGSLGMNVLVMIFSALLLSFPLPGVHV